MASVHRRSNSPFWWGAFRDASGRLIYRSTKQTERKTALKVVGKWEEAAKLARQGRLSTVQAHKIIGEILEATGQGVLETLSVRAFLSGWISSKEVTRSKGTATKYTQIVNEFLRFLGAKADAPLGGVFVSDVELFRDTQLREGRQAPTVNVKLKALRAAFNKARRQQMILGNPFEAVDFVKGDSSERRPFTLAEVRALLSVADVEWCGLILLAAFAGMREGDAIRLTWQDVDLEKGLIRYRQQKSGKALWVPMHPEVKDYFNAIPRNIKASEPIFPSFFKMKTGGCNGLSTRFKKQIMKPAGISDEMEQREKLGKGRNRSRLSFHSLRHTFVTEMANGKVSEEMRRKLAGHSSNAHQLYTHFAIETLRDAVSQIPRVGDTNTWKTKAAAS